MSEHVDAAFFEMETHRAISKRRNVLNLAGDTHLRALPRSPALTRHHRHLARAIVHLIKAERHERDVPRTGDSAFHFHLAVEVSRAIVLNVANRRGPERTCRGRDAKHRHRQPAPRQSSHDGLRVSRSLLSGLSSAQPSRLAAPSATALA